MLTGFEQQMTMPWFSLMGAATGLTPTLPSLLLHSLQR